MSLNESVAHIKGVGEKTEKLFNKLGVFTKSDLLKYYPRDYDRFEPVVHISEVTEGKVCAVRASLKGGIAVSQGNML